MCLVRVYRIGKMELWLSHLPVMQERTVDRNTTDCFLPSYRGCSTNTRIKCGLLPPGPTRTNSLGDLAWSDSGFVFMAHHPTQFLPADMLL
jgi:hypothetical protein